MKTGLSAFSSAAGLFLGFAVLLPVAQAETIVEKGAYLTVAGGCLGCHTNTSEGSQPFAGGRALKTPFGVFYSPNITPDPENGIGRWNDSEFLAALKKGVSPSGHPYFPVFPYPSYTKMTDKDALAIKAYLFTLPKASIQDKPHEVSAPLSWRWLQWGWRALFFDDEPYSPAPNASEKVARGGYLVEALTHCGECHTPRNSLGAPDKELYLAGTIDGPDREIVPNITPDDGTGIGDWSEADIAGLMKSGMLPDFDNVQGSMAEVIDHSLSKLTDDDLAAIAAYLKSIPAIKNTVAKPKS